jgi:hypothetical protein
VNQPDHINEWPDRPVDIYVRQRRWVIPDAGKHGIGIECLEAILAEAKAIHAESPDHDPLVVHIDGDRLVVGFQEVVPWRSI